jgi:23S rRNA pseudouridine2605 synthase
MPAIRLQKVLAAAGVASRRAAEALIRDGRVTVNGLVVTVPGTRADPWSDDIRIDGRRVPPPARLRYFLVNKPSGCVTTRTDPQGRPTVLDLLRGVPGYLYPVGRLDFESEGLLIVTNDGDLAARLTHPRYGLVKTYHVIVKGRPSRAALDRLRHGIVIDGRRTAPATVRAGRTFARGRGMERTELVIAIHEGRNRQVRRMCAAVGHPVERLTRTAIGPLRDSRLRPGTWRELTPQEVARLKAAASRASGGAADPAAGAAHPPRTSRPT